MKIHINNLIFILLIILASIASYIGGYSSGLRDGRWTYELSNAPLTMLKFRLLKSGKIDHVSKYELLAVEDAVYANHKLENHSSPIFFLFLDDAYINEKNSKKMFLFLQENSENTNASDCETKDQDFNKKFSTNIDKCKERLDAIKKFMDQQKKNEVETQ